MAYKLGMNYAKRERARGRKEERDREGHTNKERKRSSLATQGQPRLGKGYREIYASHG